MKEPALSGDSIIVAAEKQVWTELDSEAVILSVESGMCYGLSAVGARVWNLIQEPKTVNEVRDALLREYDVDPRRCETQLQELLRELAATGLLELEGHTRRDSLQGLESK